MAQAVSQVEFEHFQLETEEQNDFLEATQMKYSLNIKEESKNKLFKKYKHLCQRIFL